MRVTAIKCLKCGCVIFSRARHDFRSCKCESISIDGGFDYTKISCPEKWTDKIKPFSLIVKQTKLELYKDWNNSKDKYGLIELGVCDRDCKKCKRRKKK